MNWTPLILACLLLYFPIGYIVYRIRYPKGFVSHDADPERERLLRTGRRRVLPLPRRRNEQ